MKSALLTGGTGFVGANLARRLLADGHDVTLMVRPGHAPWRIRSLQGHVRLIEADLQDAVSVEQAVRAARPDWIFHLAAYGAYPSQVDLDRTVRTNVLGAMNLVQAGLAVGFEVFVNTGSSSEYGYTSAAPAETQRPEPNSGYAWGKVCATQFCRFSAQRHNVRMPTLRLYSVYGPYEEPSRFLPTLIAHGRRGDLPPLADPAVARDYVYVDDVSEAFVRAAHHTGGDPGAIYNVGTGTQSTLADVVAVARRHLPIRQEPVWGSMANRAWDTTVWVSDNRKISQELGWTPGSDLEDGFRRFVDWFDAHPDLAARYDRPGQQAATVATVAGRP